LHPGLNRFGAKFGEKIRPNGLMVPRLEEIIDRGHKALVFSQFTSSCVGEALMPGE